MTLTLLQVFVFYYQIRELIYLYHLLCEKIVSRLLLFFVADCMERRCISDSDKWIRSAGIFLR